MRAFALSTARQSLVKAISSCLDGDFLTVAFFYRASRHASQHVLLTPPPGIDGGGERADASFSGGAR